MPGQDDHTCLACFLVVVVYSAAAARKIFDNKVVVGSRDEGLDILLRERGKGILGLGLGKLRVELGCLVWIGLYSVQLAK